MRKEILILGIIFLFIGVGIQPAFAVEVSNDSTSENIDDCNCKVVDNYNLVRLERLSNRIDSFIDRVEICNKLIPILYKDNPEIIKVGEELSEQIKPLKETNEELKTAISGWDFPIICAILLPLTIALGYTWAIIAELFGKYYWDNLIVAVLLLGPLILSMYLWLGVESVADIFGCLPDS